MNKQEGRQILLFIIALIIVIVSFMLVVSRREAGRYGTNTKEEFVGICASAIETASQKEGRKERALALLSERGKLGNAEIRAELGVASRTVVKYMDELEREGKVEQIGSVGQGVVYRLK